MSEFYVREKKNSKKFLVLLKWKIKASKLNSLILFLQVPSRREESNQVISTVKKENNKKSKLVTQSSFQYSIFYLQHELLRRSFT